MESIEFRQSLAETIAWCTRDPGFEVATHSPEFKEHLKIRALANDLFHKARRRVRQSFFRRNVAKTPEWSQAMRLLKRDSTLGIFAKSLFRSPELAPPQNLNEAADETTRAAIVGRIIKARAKCLHSLGSLIVRTEKLDLAGGRLVFHFPTENLADGAAQVASAGVFDVNNVPPWDTWVGFSQETLVSWIPGWLVSLVELGIAVNPEECIRWAD